MTGPVVVDTDVISYLFKEDSRSLAYRDILQDCELTISFMSLAELHRWATRSGWGRARLSRFDYFLDLFLVLHSDEALCRRWAEVTEARFQAGRPISCADTWVAATALELGCPLVTHNSRDYEMIPTLEVRTAAT